MVSVWAGCGRCPKGATGVSEMEYRACLEGAAHGLPKIAAKETIDKIWNKLRAFFNYLFTIIGSLN
jgi:hypothetical protein